MLSKGQCAQNLSLIISEIEDKQERDRVHKSISRFMQMHYELIKDLKNIKSKKNRETLYKLWKQDLIKQIIRVPQKIYTHAVNTLVAKARDSIFKEL